MLNKFLIAVSCLFISTSALADRVVSLYFTASGQPSGELIGTVTISKTPYGLLFTPNLNHLSPGIHGFHIHQNPSCAENGMAAGGHLDPKNSSKHLGPYNSQGHIGDLPALYITAEGTATIPVLAPRLTSFKAIEDHALMVHAGGDNYSDEPAKLGGGGNRMACGVIK
jgi:superoxide dismutase, Cu-Zn family